jgi:hypothetical protein
VIGATAAWAAKEPTNARPLNIFAINEENTDTQDTFPLPEKPMRDRPFIIVSKSHIMVISADKKINSGIGWTTLLFLSVLNRASLVIAQ